MLAMSRPLTGDGFTSTVLRSNGRSKVAILGDVEQAACASDPALHADRALTETVTKQTDADCLLICAAIT